MPTLDLYNLKGFNEDLIRTILSMYLSDGKDDIAEIIKSAEENNFTLAGKKSHKLTGSSKTVGALDVAEIAEKLENIFMNNPDSYHKQLIIELQEKFSEVEKHIKHNDLTY